MKQQACSRPHLFTALVALATASLVFPAQVGCSRLPDFAAPKTSQMDPKELESGDRVDYRPLTREDFRRTAPPQQTTVGKYTLGALTCTALHTLPGLTIQVETTTYPDGRAEHRAWAENLRFHASMDRDCSWWNPTNKDLAYTLQHEQVHFALTELAARRMNQRVPEWLRKLRTTASTREKAVAPINEALAEYLNDYTEELNDRQRSFDEDTSVGRNPQRQQEWYDRVLRELAETERYH
jgi:hypothetical protein